VRDFIPEVSSQEVDRLYEKMKPINTFKLYELINSFCKKQLVSQLLRERIEPKKHIFLDPIWRLMELSAKELSNIHKNDRRVADATWNLFQRNIKDTINKESINFSEVF
jgi:glutathionylspermidine synthase